MDCLLIQLVCCMLFLHESRFPEIASQNCECEFLDFSFYQIS